MKVREVMNSNVRTCRPHESVNEAARSMWEWDCGCLPVIDDQDRVIGMITDRDVCMAAYTQGRPLHLIGVQSAMSSSLRVCQPEDEIATAEAIMREFQIRRLPVLNSQGQAVGIVSLSDLALEFQRERQTKKRKDVDADQVAETLAAICGHANGAEVPVTVGAGA